jgi:protein ImuA
MDLNHLTYKETNSSNNITILPQATLAWNRVHECKGPSKIIFALWLAQKVNGTILWISEVHSQQTLNPDGIYPYVNPAQFLFAKMRHKEDILWSIEEAMRSAACPLIVVDISSFNPGLTPIRRINLAGRKIQENVMAVLLTSDEYEGVQGVETRWHMAPIHDDINLKRKWRLERLKARMAPPKFWSVSHHHKTGFQKIDKIDETRLEPSNL